MPERVGVSFCTFVGCGFPKARDIKYKSITTHNPIISESYLEHAMELNTEFCSHGTRDFLTSPSQTRTIQLRPFQWPDVVCFFCTADSDQYKNPKALKCTTLYRISAGTEIQFNWRHWTTIQHIKLWCNNSTGGSRGFALEVRNVGLTNVGSIAICLHVVTHHIPERVLAPNKKRSSHKQHADVMKVCYAFMFYIAGCRNSN